MSRFHLFLWPLLGCSTLLLTGALGKRAPGPADPAEPGPAAPPDPAALKALDQAAETLLPERVTWLEMTVWQRLACEELTYESEGRYLLGPGRRLRFASSVRVGNTRGEFLTVSDGATLWRVVRAGADGPTVVRVRLTPVLGALDGPGADPRVREAVLSGMGFAGPAPLLRDVRQRLLSAQQERERWQ